MVQVCTQSQQVHSAVGAEEMLGLALGLVDRDGETDSVGLTVGLELFTKLGFAVLVPLKHKSQSEWFAICTNPPSWQSQHTSSSDSRVSTLSGKPNWFPSHSNKFLKVKVKPLASNSFLQSGKLAQTCRRMSLLHTSTIGAALARKGLNALKTRMYRDEENFIMLGTLCAIWSIRFYLSCEKAKIFNVAELILWDDWIYTFIHSTYCIPSFANNNNNWRASWYWLQLLIGVRIQKFVHKPHPVKCRSEQRAYRHEWHYK